MPAIGIEPCLQGDGGLLSQLILQGANGLLQTFCRYRFRLSR